MKIKHIAATASVSLCALALAGYRAQADNLFEGSEGGSTIVEFSGGTQTTFATGLNNPSGLTFDSSGDLFEADGSGNVYEWVGAGTTRTTFASGLNNPAFMAVNTAGDVFVNCNGGAIEEFSPAGSLINTISGLSSSGLSGLAFDKAGNLYVAALNGSAAGAGVITKITPLGVQSTFASGLNYPTGIAFNAAGDLFVGDGNLNDAVTEITPAGVESTYATGLDNPNDVAVDRAGDVFVADIGTYGAPGDVTEIAPNGTTTVLSSSLGSPAALAVQPVPEPSEYALCGLGLAACLLRYNTKKRVA